MAVLVLRFREEIRYEAPMFVPDEILAEGEEAANDYVYGQIAADGSPFSYDPDQLDVRSRTWQFPPDAFEEA